MPWPAPFSGRSSLSYGLLALALGVLVSCTTVASSPATEPPTASLAPSPVPTLEVSLAPSPSFEPLPTASARPSATDAVPPSASAPPANTVEPIAQPAIDQAAPAAGASLDGKTTRKLQAILDNQVQNKGVAGLQAAVRLPSGETWLGTAGSAEFSPDRPIEDDTQFAIASVTKTFIAALILSLAEEGKVDLDTPFGTYFRDAPRKDKVTLRQLLSHTSGIYDFWANPRYYDISTAWWKTPNAGGLKARDHRWTYEEMMSLVKDGPFKPGQDYQYSNTNYVILGKVAEAVEGQPIHKQLRRRFFKPLGMEDTVYQPAEKPAADAAHGHWNWGGGYTDHTGDSAYVPFMAAASIADAAGAIASTARDLSIWADALYGGEVLSHGMLKQMTTFLRPGLYGLGADVAVFAGNRAHGHRGGIRGFESSMWHFPASGVSIVLLSNQGNWLTDVPMEKLVKTVLGSN